MARPVGGQQWVKAARAAVGEAKSVHELRMAQAMLLPVAFGLNLNQVAEAIGVGTDGDEAAARLCAQSAWGAVGAGAAWRAAQRAHDAGGRAGLSSAVPGAGAAGWDIDCPAGEAGAGPALGPPGGAVFGVSAVASTWLAEVGPG